MFPAVDIAHSATRKDDQLLAKDEAAVVADIRRALGSVDSVAGLGVVLDGLSSSASNVEFLVAMHKKLPNLGL
jgi:transcription termination factor Rho